MTTWWTIVDAEGAPLCPCIEVAGVDAPDPAIYGGASILALDGPIDPAGMVWDDGGWSINLTARKAALVDAACARAEAVRAIYLTPGSGQAMTYTRKEAEARSWSPGDDPATVPFVAAEAMACGMSIDDLVALIVAQADAWIAIGSAIEARRRGLLVAIDAATMPAELDAINIEEGWPG